MLTGQAALGDWTTDAPGVRRRLTLDDLPKPNAAESVKNRPKEVKRVLESNFSGREDYNLHVFQLLGLELWHRTFLD